MSRDDAPPLVVDVDGTLLRTDLLWEGTVALLSDRPAKIFPLLRALFRGRGGLKAYVARESGLATGDLPLEPHVLELIRAARADGRRVVLASGADEGQVRSLARRVGADGSWGSDGVISLTGRGKLRRIAEEFSSFDYVGNAAPDLPLWKEARRCFAVNASPRVIRTARKARPDLRVLNGTATGRVPWLRAVRPHQWSKNALLFLPALAAHVPWTLDVALALALGFLSFSAVASGVYLVNDVLDVRSDRTHPTKRDRPVAAGEISIPGALAGSGVLVLAGALLALPLPGRFQVVLALYLAAVLAYSLRLKRYAILDVITLASLYATRVVAGAALVGVPLSRWFLAFSVFFFLSLALVKRVVELHDSGVDRKAARGRDYMASDLPALRSLGASTAAASALVYCLYITDESVGELYRYPDVLWFGFPILLYWLARVWLRTGRGEMHGDPVIFALRDRVSYVLLGVFLLTVWIAA